MEVHADGRCELLSVKQSDRIPTASFTLPNFPTSTIHLSNLDLHVFFLLLAKLTIFTKPLQVLTSVIITSSSAPSFASSCWPRSPLDINLRWAFESHPEKFSLQTQLSSVKELIISSLNVPLSQLHNTPHLHLPTLLAATSQQSSRTYSHDYPSKREFLPH